MGDDVRTIGSRVCRKVARRERKLDTAGREAVSLRIPDETPAGRSQTWPKDQLGADRSTVKSFAGNSSRGVPLRCHQGHALCYTRGAGSARWSPDCSSPAL